ncbi:MAG TPA: SWIM zinc finger family protein [Gemmataceae bacterium]|nr:SWIM zinc finger family protein [Gemmataceae bacterium]
MPLTEDVIQRAAPDAGSLQNGRDLVRKKAFSTLGVSEDGTWLLGNCKGSGKEPYSVSVDLANDSSPVGRCNCPSRKFPCKHALGLMVAYLANPGQFGKAEPPEDLVAKREKQVARAEKKTTEAPAPRKVNKAAQVKKAQAQRDGLDLLEKLLIDLVAAGQWFEEGRLDRLDRQAKQMADSYLPGARVMLRRLVLLGQEDGLPEEERTARAADLIGHLWATVQKGRNYLDDKLSADEDQAEAEAVMEEVLGTVWQLADLKEKGYTRQDLNLLELAYERFDDAARAERIETSHLLDLGDGSVHAAITYRPVKGLAKIAEQPSWMQPITVLEVAVYPGFLNRRIRWEKGAEVVQPLEKKNLHLKQAHALAAPEFEKVLAEFRKQLKHPLAPREAVVWVRCQTVGKVGERVVVEDAKGARIEAVDRKKDYSNVANLVRAAGELRKQPALLARLFVLPLPNTIVAEPLALLSPEKHLRLGL